MSASLLNVERCARCGVFYSVPAADSHSAEECAAQIARQPLPTREPSNFKKPNQPVRIT